MISPTGHGVRGIDAHGSGEYGTGRGNRIHKGADFIVFPIGQDVVSPISGTIIRKKKPYKDDLQWSGCLIRNKVMEVTLFYMVPDMDKIGTNVKEGEVIGHAQDISQRYKGMIPHVHMQIDSIDPELLIGLP